MSEHGETQKEPNLDHLKRKMAEQAADLVNKAKVPPLTLATMMLDLAVALPMSMGVSADAMAICLSAHAARLEKMAAFDKGRASFN